MAFFSPFPPKTWGFWSIGNIRGKDPGRSLCLSLRDAVPLPTLGPPWHFLYTLILCEPSREVCEEESDSGCGSLLFGCPRAICCHSSSHSTFSILVSVSRITLTFGFGYPASASGNQELLCCFSLKTFIFP